MIIRMNGIVLQTAAPFESAQTPTWESQMGDWYHQQDMPDLSPCTHAVHQTLCNMSETNADVWAATKFTAALTYQTGKALWNLPWNAGEMAMTTMLKVGHWELHGVVQELINNIGG